MKRVENTQSPVCIICGWPINRLLNVRDILPKLIKWIKENSKRKTYERIMKRLSFLFGLNELAICRFDFFFMIKEIISIYDKELSKKFEDEVVSQYDFNGSLIS